MNSVELLYQDALDLLLAKREATTLQYRLDFILGDTLISTTKVMALDRINKFDSEVGEGMIVSAVIGAGTFNKVLYPSRKNIKARLYREAVNPDTHKPYPARTPFIKDYDCTFITEGSDMITDADEIANSKDLGDRDKVVDVQVQLIDPILNVYIKRSIYTILKDVTMEEVLLTLLGNDPAGPDDPAPRVTSAEDWVEGRYSGIVGVDVFPPDNDKRYSHVVIPTGIKLIDLPDYLQVKYGIYNHGLANYIKDGIVYIYPLTNYDRVKDVKRTLTIANIAKERALGATNTWRLPGNGEVFVVATGDVTHSDTSEIVELNDGIIKYAMDSANVMDNPVVRESGKATVFVGDNIKFTEDHARSDGGSYADLAKGRILSNLFHENSKVNSGKVAQLTIEWQYSYPEILYPGMPVTYLFPAGDTVLKLTGTLAMVDSQTYPIRTGFGPSGHYTSTMLGIIVKSVGTA